VGIRLTLTPAPTSTPTKRSIPPSSLSRIQWESRVLTFFYGSTSYFRSTIPKLSSAALGLPIVRSLTLSIVRSLGVRVHPVSAADIFLKKTSGYSHDTRQNERETRIRIYSEFQSDAECFQSKADRKGAFMTPLHSQSTLAYLREKKRSPSPSKS
jgi:hypothetical protein